MGIQKLVEKGDAMKTIGLLGGMSWESSLEYYRILNEEVKRVLGETHSAKCLMYSVDFHEIEILQRKGDWDQLSTIMVENALRLKHGGADCIVICANTMHKMAGLIKTSTGLPIIHIGEEVGKAIFGRGLKKIALLGTEYTMTGEFYREKLRYFGIETIIPGDAERKIIHDIIYDELILGKFKQESKIKILNIIEDLYVQEIEGVILGCTELPLLISQKDLDVPVFDTTDLHAKGAIEYALDGLIK